MLSGLLLCSDIFRRQVKISHSQARLKPKRLITDLPQPQMLANQFSNEQLEQQYFNMTVHYHNNAAHSIISVIHYE